MYLNYNDNIRKKSITLSDFLDNDDDGIFILDMHQYWLD